MTQKVIKKENIYPLLCLAIFCVAFTIGAYKPLYPQDWFLESILGSITVILLICTYKKFRFSNTSYTLLLIFLILQVIGSHYTYSETPIGFWIKDLFNLSRNHYDRLIHFLFGLLLYLPALELWQKLSHTTSKTLLNYSIPVIALIALGGSFEVIEWIVAIIVSPELGIAYLGTQGDVWDAQKDIAVKIIGSLMAMLYFVWSSQKIKES